MGEDRHELYRMTYNVLDLDEFIEKYRDRHTVAYIAYVLLRVKEAHPTCTMKEVISKAKTYLDGFKQHNNKS